MRVVLLPKEKPDFADALINQDASWSETQCIFSSIFALRTNEHTFISNTPELQCHTKNNTGDNKTLTHLDKVHIYSVKFQPLAFVEKRNLCLRRAFSPEEIKADNTVSFHNKNTARSITWSPGHYIWQLSRKKKKKTSKSTLAAWPLLEIGVSSEGDAQWVTVCLHPDSVFVCRHDSVNSVCPCVAKSAQWSAAYAYVI